MLIIIIIRAVPAARTTTMLLESIAYTETSYTNTLDTQSLFGPSAF